MKKKITVWIIAVILTTNAVFAGSNNIIPERVNSAFQKEFFKADNVNWQVINGYYKVSFTLNDQVLFAYYMPNGQKVAIARNILSDKLPINLFIDLKKNYSDYWITNLVEFSKSGETSYYLTLNKADDELMLKASNASWFRVGKF